MTTAIAHSRTPTAAAIIAASTPLSALPVPRRIAHPRDLLPAPSEPAPAQLPAPQP